MTLQDHDKRWNMGSYRLVFESRSANLKVPFLDSSNTLVDGQKTGSSDLADQP
jgi:hypothetical protein